LAVLRLIASSYLVGACTGSSATLEPLRMRSTYTLLILAQLAHLVALLALLTLSALLSARMVDSEVAGDQRAGWRDPRTQAFPGAHAYGLVVPDVP
jgi:hypothetical protein